MLALCGRVHMYEGRPNSKLAMGVRLLSLLGVQTLLVTSAVSSLDESLLPGHIMLVDEHINLSGANVLTGEHEPRFGPRFTGLSQTDDPNLICQPPSGPSSISTGRATLTKSRQPSADRGA
jgi:purine-nucleoside phosphorylase